MSIMLARAVELKADLIHYATSGRFGRELSAVLGRFHAGGPPRDEAEAFLPVDYLAHQEPLTGGDTVIDRFVRERPDLGRADVELLTSWKDVVEGVFEVRAVDGAAVLLFNHVDELVYRAFSNLGEEAFTELLPRMQVVGRLIPIGPDWLISGTPAVHPAEARGELVDLAARIALTHAGWVFRNPVLLTQARELQAEQRRCFVGYFGTDLVVLRGAEVRDRLRGYLAYQAGRLGSGEWGDRQPGRLEPPEHVSAAATVALIYDEEAGLGYYADFGMLEEVFDDPRLIVRSAYRELVSAYLRGDAVSPVPLLRLAGRDADKASAVFAGLLNKRGFRWERSGELLLRAHKPVHFTAEPLPTVIPVTAAIAEHLSPSNLSPST
ncbi:hypothetical protein [Nonomuraea rhizosphaerae]|uniref:hypothetical protein n=1 Tax=Nonomuraea rhizosphaerae TaxID=2665663 RepID=UPI001C5EC2BD|nr:hypothetical protein [Nonomuraea rhizosphaerae]